MSARLAAKVSNKINSDVASHSVIRWVDTADYSVVKLTAIQTEGSLSVGMVVDVKVPDRSGRMKSYRGSILAKGNKASMESSCARLAEEAANRSYSDSGNKTTDAESSNSQALVSPLPHVSLEGELFARCSGDMRKPSMKLREEKGDRHAKEVEDRYKIMKNRGAKRARESDDCGDKMHKERCPSWSLQKKQGERVQESEGHIEMSKDRCPGTALEKKQMKRGKGRKCHGDELSDERFQEVSQSWKSLNEAVCVDKASFFDNLDSEETNQMDGPDDFDKGGTLSKILDCVEDVLRRVKNLEKKGIGRFDVHSEEDQDMYSMESKQPTARNKSPIMYNGVDLTSFYCHPKQPQKYARKVLAELFSTEELSVGIYSKAGHTSRVQLDRERIAILEDCLYSKYGKKMIERNTCNQ